MSPTNLPHSSSAISVHWIRPVVRQSKHDRLFCRIAFAVFFVFDGVYSLAVARSWGIGACCLVAALFTFGGYLFVRFERKPKPNPTPIQFHAEQANGGLQLSEISNWEEAESLCNYFSKKGFYPAIDLPSGPPCCQVLLIGMTIECFARLLEGASIEPI